MAFEKNFSEGILEGAVAIGIDQSLTGFAFTAINVANPSIYETWVYRSPFNGVQRLDNIQTFMFDKFEYLKEKKCNITEIAMESPFLGSPSTLPLSELAAAVKLFLYNHFDGINNYSPAPPQHLRTPLVVPPMTLKKYATGKGTSKKQEMLLQMYKRWGVEFNDDNAADSYALARLASGNVMGAVEAEIIEKLKDVKYRDIIQ
jgi:Holliday junction resolvasome RuvABC endonuclease subunit